MRIDWTKGLLFAGAIVLGGFAPACSCGDDGTVGDGDGDGDGDAAPDAPEVTATRAGTIALTQLSVVDDDATVTATNLAGAAFTVAYDDLTTLGAAPSFEGNPTGANGCTVFEFTGPGFDQEAAEVDEAPVAITGFGSIGNINCAFVSAEIGYQCAPAADASATVTMGSLLGDPDGNGVSAFATANGAVDFTAVNGSTRGALGMTITFPTGTWPTNPTNDGTFPIVNVVNAGTVAIVHPAATAETLAADTMDYSLTVGNAPIPGGYHLYAEDDGSEANAAFTVAGGGSETGAIDAFSESITPATLTTFADAKLNVRLIDGNTDPEFEPFNLPTTEFTISCDNAVGGNCENGSPISALIVSGRTTDGTLPTTGNPLVDELEMPDPVGTYTTFTCVFLGQKQGTISQEALDAIHAGNPTRIETRVIYASGLINTEDDGDRVNLLAGYGVIGFTTP